MPHRAYDAWRGGNMPSWKDFLEQIAVIRAAPTPFALAVIFLTAMLWILINIVNQGTISAKDATIETLKTQNDAYKEKLSGATPEQAKAQIEGMKGQIEALETKISTLGARRLKEHQRLELIENLKLPADIAHPTTSVSFEMGCSDCQSYAREIANTMRSVNGWEKTSLDNASMLVLGNQTDVRFPGGIEIKVLDKNNLRPEQKILISTFNEAEIKFDLIQDTLPPPAGTMLIQVNPAPP
jgi:hypothetical protein